MTRASVSLQRLILIVVSALYSCGQPPHEAFETEVGLDLCAGADVSLAEDLGGFAYRVRVPPRCQAELIERTAIAVGPSCRSALRGVEVGCGYPRAGTQTVSVVRESDDTFLFSVRS